VSQVVAEEQVEYTSKASLQKEIGRIRKAMERAAKDMDFMEAARLRDVMFDMEKKLGSYNA